jgi:hypothetical protein
MKIGQCKNCGKEITDYTSNFCSKDCVMMYFESEKESI